jgi:kynureninase
MRTRDAAIELDRRDPLAPLGELFELPEGVTYLDGNSLGALPKATAVRLDAVVRCEWGSGLIRSWNSAGWIDLAQRIGDHIAPLLGAGRGEVAVADSTSVNLYKVLSAAAALVKADAPARRVIVAERGNFPTDLYIAESVARQHGFELRLVDAAAIADHLDDRLALLMLTHVDYRSGRMHDMAAMTQAAHDAGGLMVWDLAHSAGAVPLNLHGGAAGGGAGGAADFAVGCGYKYLNGGPGAPAFLWAHPQHTARMDRSGLRQPLSGWLGHAAPFDFRADYQPAAGIARFACGTPALLSLAALECGVGVFQQADALGGIEALRQKSIALCGLFIEAVETLCAGRSLALATPRDPSQRGSQVSFAHPGGYAVMQALIARGVIGDFRAPDILRFGFTPLYTRYIDAWDAAQALAEVLSSGEWQEPRFSQRAAVT